MSNVHIELAPYGRDGKVVVDGRDIGHDVRGFAFAHEHGSLPQLSLDLVVRDITTIDADHVQLLISPENVNLLERAGWTPPGGHQRLIAAAAALDQALRGLTLPDHVMARVAELAAALHEARA